MVVFKRFASIYLAVGLCCFHVVYVESAQERQYSKHVLCDVESRIREKCMQFVGHTRSKLECATRCSKDPLSNGYSVNGTSCFSHFYCEGVDGCGQENHDHAYYRRAGSGGPCFNGGHWVEALQSCKCSNGWISEFCETRAKSCKELYDWHYGNGILVVFLDIKGSSRIWKVVCYRERHYIRTYVAGNIGKINFNRTWDEYENGFFEENWNGIPSFFIGLRPLYLLRKAGLREFVVGASFWSSSTNRQTSQTSLVDQIMVDTDIRDANHFYELDFKHVLTEQFGPISSTLTQNDCMTPVKKSEFSTWDQYQASGENHALTSGAGWWFSDTGSPCNILGEHCRPTEATGSQCVAIDGISRDIFAYQLRFTRLFFREPV